MINPDFAFNAMRLLDSRDNDIFCVEIFYYSDSLCFGASN